MAASPPSTCNCAKVVSGKKPPLPDIAIQKAGLRPQPGDPRSVMAAGRHHRFKVGDRLRMAAGAGVARAGGACRVTFLLPFERGQVLYRVKADNEGFERVVPESDLERA